MATLVIGVGGTGYEAIQRLKNVLPENANSLRYYYLDSAQRETGTQPPGSARYIGGFDVANTVEHQWRNISKWWFPRDYMPDYMATLGTGKNRLIGRLNFFMNGEAIAEDLRAIFQGLSGNSLTIYVVCSVGGGQGSSICVDVAMLCQEILGGGDVKFDIIAVLLDPTVVFNTIDNDENSITAGLASLTEIEYFNGLKARKSLQKYEFSALGQAPIKKDEPPFDLVFLIQYKNLKGEMFESKADYYEMLACGIKDLIAVSDHSDNIMNYPGAKGGTGIENFFLGWNSKGNRGGFSTKWGSFGTVELRIPIEKIGVYCTQRSAYDVISQFLTPLAAGEATQMDTFVHNLFSGQCLWESNQSEQIQGKIIGILRKDEKAKDLIGARGELVNRLTLALHASQRNFDTTLNNKARELKDILAEHASSSKDIFRHPEFLALKQTVLIELENQKNLLLSKGNVCAAEYLLIEFKNSVQREIQDLEANERAWLNKAQENVLLATINSQVTEIKAKKKRLFEKEAKFLDRIKPKKIQLAKYWIENFHRFYFLTTFLSGIERFYNELNKEADKLLIALAKFREEMVDLRSSYAFSGILMNSIDIVERKTGNADFILEICSSESVVSRKIFSQIKLSEIREALLSEGIDSIKAARINTIVGGTVKRTIMEHLNLQTGLQYEADFLYEDIIEKFNKLPPHQLKDMRNDYKKYIDVNCFDQIWDLFQNEEKGARVIKDEYIKAIARGRILPLLAKFAAPFWSYDKAVLKHPPGTQSRTLISMASSLSWLQGILQADYSERCPFYNDNNPYHMNMFFAEGGMFIYALSQLAGLADKESARRKIYFKDGKPLSPDTRGINDCFYNDRAFIEDDEKNSFLIFLEDNDEEVYKYFGLAELFGLLSSSARGRSNFKLTVGLDSNFPAGFALGKGLKQALSAIKNSGVLFDLLKKKSEELLERERIKNMADLRAKVLELYKSYGSLMGSATPELKEIYQDLRYSLEGLGLIDSVNPS